MIGESRTERYNVSLPPDVAERLRVIGGGNLSAGIRLALVNMLKSGGSR